MALWLVRAGKHGEREELALENDIAVIGWDELPDVGGIADRSELTALIEETYPEASLKTRMTCRALASNEWLITEPESSTPTGTDNILKPDCQTKGCITFCACVAFLYKELSKCKIGIRKPRSHPPKRALESFRLTVRRG